MSMNIRTIHINIFFNLLIFFKLRSCFHVNCNFILENYPTKKTQRVEIKNILKRRKSGIEEIQMKMENKWISKGELINPIKNVNVENSRVEKFLFFHFFFHPVQRKYYRTRNFWRVNSFLQIKFSYIISILFLILSHCLIFFY